MLLITSRGDYFSMNTEVPILTKNSSHKLPVQDFHSYYCHKILVFAFVRYF